MNGRNWLQVWLVFLIVSIVGIGNGWASLLELGVRHSAISVDSSEFRELMSGRAYGLSDLHGLSHLSEAIWKLVDDSKSCDGNMQPIDVADGPEEPCEDRNEVGHYSGDGTTGNSRSANGVGGTNGGGVLSGEMIWVAGIPISDWLTSRLRLIWSSPPIRELLKVPIA